MQQQKVAVITGASRGLGFATAELLASRGYAVVLAARNAVEIAAAAQKLSAGGANALGVATDVGTSAGADRLIAAAIHAFGRIDVLVNNAGVAPLGAIEKTTDAQFESLLSANIAAVFYCTRRAWPEMRNTGGGVIVNISSLASIDPFPGFAAYGASKAWVNLFTRAAADEGRACGVRVFAVAPGAVETAMLREHFPDFPKAQTLSPQDVANVVVSCVDPQMGHASGSTIFVRK